MCSCGGEEEHCNNIAVDDETDNEEQCSENGDRNSNSGEDGENV